MGAEPRHRERSPGQGLVDPDRRAATATAQGKEGWFIRGSSWNFIGGFLVHLPSGKCRNGLHQLGASPLSRLVSRGPRPGH